jgi:hypothetical protein
VSASLIGCLLGRRGSQPLPSFLEGLPFEKLAALFDFDKVPLSFRRVKPQTKPE